MLDPTIFPVGDPRRELYTRMNAEIQNASSLGVSIGGVVFPPLANGLCPIGYVKVGLRGIGGEWIYHCETMDSLISGTHTIVDNPYIPVLQKSVNGGPALSTPQLHTTTVEQVLQGLNADLSVKNAIRASFGSIPATPTAPASTASILTPFLSIFPSLSGASLDPGVLNILLIGAALLLLVIIMKR